MREQVYPRSGFKRATRYVLYRMRRLPDQPHRIARGVFVGSLIGFLPLPGMQFIAAWLSLVCTAVRFSNFGAAGICACCDETITPDTAKTATAANDNNVNLSLFIYLTCK